MKLSPITRRCLNVAFALKGVLMVAMALLAYRYLPSSPDLALVYFEEGVVMVPEDKVDAARTKETARNRVLYIAAKPREAKVDVLLHRTDMNLPRTVTYNYHQLAKLYADCDRKFGPGFCGDARKVDDIVRDDVRSRGDAYPLYASIAGAPDSRYLLGLQEYAP